MLSTPLRVAVRVRPPQPHDGRLGEAAVAPLSETEVEVRDGSGDRRAFVFDRVFGPASPQHEVYACCALPLIEAVLEGTNGCLFAFGSTGAGKTHSMLGPEGGRSRASQDGVLPRSAAELFRRIARLESDAAAAIGAGGFSEYEVRASFLEVYCQSVFDLLGGPVSASRDAASACSLREEKDGRVFAEGAREVRVRSVAELTGLVAQGAAARATAATGVHAHSSRSHALLVLTVEHRWRDVGEPDPCRFRAQTSRLTLVDLAGAESMERSHDGCVDTAGVSTNLGLLVLSRVIRALANGERVPYRDSTLTRLMQSSLGGAALTWMLACVSPAFLEVPQSASTLGYATSARNVKLCPLASAVRDDVYNDPMAGDSEDTDLQLNRRAIWIETSFGDVFARCVGNPADPLILYIHGSGPKNSSMVWNLLCLDIQRLASQNRDAAIPKSFFHVAIDCPGYGRSPGDRQTIRSYPGSFLLAIVSALGRRTVAALVGSSQGACAVFNCALEQPKLAHALAVCHPVGHAPQRYTAIAQPTLLIFDIEDAGHPVSVGRQMRRYLQQSRYFEFARSRDGHWEAMHMGEELFAMIVETWPASKQKRAGGRRDDRLPELVRVAGGYRAWSERYDDEYPPWYAFDLEQEENGTDTPAATYRAVLDAATNIMVYEDVSSGRRVKMRPPGARVLVERLGGADLQSSPGNASHLAPPACRAGISSLFASDSGGDSDDEAEQKERLQREAEEQGAREAVQTHCNLCQLLLVEPLRLVRCRCALCACCVERTVRYTRQCPACGEVVEKGSGGSVALEGQELQQLMLAHLNSPELQAQRDLLAELQLMRTRVCRAVLEYGNISATSGGKTSFATFLKVISAEGAAAKQCAVARVDFNINPGYSKPTFTAKEPNDKKLGFAYEYAMARPYPCYMTVHFRSELSLPRLLLSFSVQSLPKVARRIIVEFPARPAGKCRPGEVEFEAEPPRNGWVRCFDPSGRSANVEYLPEPFLG